MKLEAIYVHGFVISDCGDGFTMSEYVDMDERKPDGFCAYELLSNGPESGEWDGGEEQDFATLDDAMAWAEARAAAHNVPVRVY
jgi:hypothetical protein